VASCHVLIKGLYCIRPSELTELLVHVVRAGARVVTDPYTKVLHLHWFLFVDLIKHKKISQSTAMQRDAMLNSQHSRPPAS
jgi:hypothetical protein